MKAKVAVKETKSALAKNGETALLDDRLVFDKLKKYVKSSKFVHNDDRLIEELRKAFSNPGDSKERTEIQRKLTAKAVTLYSLDNFYGLSSAVGEVNTGRSIRFAQELYKEYDCKTASEKTIAQMAAVANERVLTFSKRLNFCISTEQIDPHMNQHMSILSKELDRANRHFTTLLLTLRQLKSPSFQVNVKTNTAFVAQNQQINANSSLAENGKEKLDGNING